MLEWGERELVNCEGNLKTEMNKESMDEENVFNLQVECVV